MIKEIIEIQDLYYEFNGKTTYICNMSKKIIDFYQIKSKIIQIKNQQHLEIINRINEYQAINNKENNLNIYRSILINKNKSANEIIGILDQYYNNIQIIEVINKEEINSKLRLAKIQRIILLLSLTLTVILVIFWKRK